ncbi:unnamed protein product [Toxocara canis]|uniref:Uncharacterized protein n=1 Tax=Toxocara canis TaxID=6265 RepID=A0A183TZF4_TOXCA|nr:unnamed protein product [Toxocara canis]
MDRSAIDRNGIQTRDAKAGDGYAGSSQPSPRNREDDNVHPSSEARTNVKQPCEMHSAGEQAASGQTGAAVSSEVAMSSKCPSTVHESGASTSRVSVESKVAAGSRADRAQEGNKVIQFILLNFELEISLQIGFYERSAVVGA